MARLAVASRFECPSDCARCCSDLTRDVPADERRAARDFRALLRGLGVYTCTDAPETGLSLTPAEARALRREADARGHRLKLHPRTYLLDTRRRIARVLEWHLAHASCPFLDGFRCGAYEARPLVCRAYPVLAPAPSWVLAPACPETAATQAAADAGRLRLGTHLGAENRARRTLEARHAGLDARAFALLDAPGARYAKGLAPREAAERLKRYRLVDADEEEGEAPRTARAKS